MYAWASALALVLSFGIVALFAERATVLSVTSGQWGVCYIVEIGEERRSWTVGKIISVALLILCVATGLLGTQDAYRNFNTTFFWIIFVLAIPYATLLFGDFYKEINPWAAVVKWIEAQAKGVFAGALGYPRALSYYPALVFYMIFIWLELFGELSPRGLSLALLSYSLVTIIGAWLFGYRDWFQYAEFFGVFLRLIGYAAPGSIRKSGTKESICRRWRLPFWGLLDVKTEHISLLLFILFMLSSTAYDGLHETLPWVETFWKGVYPFVSQYLSDHPRTSYEQALFLYKLWQWFWLIASPFVYLVVLRVFVAAAKVIAKTQYSVSDLSLRFAPALIPIAIVYHITHYYPTLFAQGVQIERLISDPFGFGWNLFGTANLNILPVMVDVGLIWKSQVALIVGGHIVSSYLAHLEALRSFPTAKRATLSQLPILLLMVMFTTLGLKILSMPLAP